ncbi:MAG: divalent-cation tolerance protein CutA [Bryobacteraceae bacterium]
MAETFIVFSTCGCEAEANRLARALVEERLAACVTVLPGLTSIYRWQGKVETASEHLLLVKTTRERLPAVENRIRELHSYELPEIIAVPITAGSEKYLAWIQEQVLPED